MGMEEGSYVTSIAQDSRRLRGREGRPPPTAGHLRGRVRAAADAVPPMFASVSSLSAVSASPPSTSRGSLRV